MKKEESVASKLIPDKKQEKNKENILSKGNINKDYNNEELFLGHNHYNNYNNAKTEANKNLKKISISSSNQTKLIKNFLKDTLSETVELLKRTELAKYLEADLTEDENKYLKNILDSIPDEIFEKLSKKLNNMRKSINKSLKNTVEVDKKAKIKKIAINRDELRQDLVDKIFQEEEQVQNLIEKVNVK